MSHRHLQLFHTLPPALKDCIATIHGYRLRHRRYDNQSNLLCEQALEREHWTSEEWHAYQSKSLARILAHASRHVAHYRNYWDTQTDSDGTPEFPLSDWPVLEKRDVRLNPADFLADCARPSKLILESTSGTTGTALKIWSSTSTQRMWYSLSEARWRRWYGVSRLDRWAILGGQLVVAVERRKPPFWVWNGGMNQLYMSSYHLAADLVPHYLSALRKYRIRYLLGYTSALYALAVGIGRNGHDLNLKVVIANAEPVFDYQRAAIEAAFGCPLRETYGMSEMVAAASECEKGRLHTWPDAGIIEVMEGGRPLPYGQVGDLVCTGLLNSDMPLIRYRVGDRGVLAPPEFRCECGRTLPVLLRVEGRSDDILYTSDGRQIGRLDPVFKSGVNVIEAQVVQETLSRIRVRVVPAIGYTPEDGQRIAQDLRKRIGTVDVVVEIVSEVPRTSGGKFRAVVCELPEEDVRRFRAVSTQHSGSAL